MERLKLEQQRFARERAEQDAFNKAKQAGTKLALSQFLSQYPNSKYARQARGMIDDYDLWSTAVRLNTLESYDNFLRQSSNKSFDAEARAKLPTARRRMNGESGTVLFHQMLTIAAALSGGYALWVLSACEVCGHGGFRLFVIRLFQVQRGCQGCRLCAAGRFVPAFLQGRPWPGALECC